MIEVHGNLFVGAQDAYEQNPDRFETWLVIQACKEPYHRRALGYSGRAAPKDHPEYLIARRDNRLILNLVDADNPSYIPDEIMDTATVAIHDALSRKQRVFLHCNLGLSRSPSIAMLYLGAYTEKLPRDSFAIAHAAFSKIYPPFTPAGGTLGFLQRRWSQFQIADI